MIIAIDFDGTIAEHKFPKIGWKVPGAFEWMEKFQLYEAKLILWTLRSDGPHYGNTLTDAVEWCKARGIIFYGVNSNPEQPEWTTSPKIRRDILIDDHNAGCPLVYPGWDHRPYVDWSIIGPWVMERIVACAKPYGDAEREMLLKAGWEQVMTEEEGCETWRFPPEERHRYPEHLMSRGQHYWDLDEAVRCQKQLDKFSD